MENFNKNSLKAAVGKYGSLYGTMSEEALREEIAKSDKGFSAEQVEEIFLALVPVVEEEHTISQEDLDLNPELVEEGVEVGEVVGLGEEVLGNELPLGGSQEQIGLYKVVTPFRDKNDFDQVHEVGQELEGFDQTRIDHLLSIGYIAQS